MFTMCGLSIFNLSAIEANIKKWNLVPGDEVAYALLFIKDMDPPP